MPESDIKRAFDTISAKRKPYSDLFNYYDGDQPVMYSTNAMREVFRNLDARFTLNFCAVVIDAVKERVSFQGFTARDAGVQAALEGLVYAQDWLNEADETHQAAFVCGEAFVMVWPQLDLDGQETGGVDIFYNDPRNVTIFYESDNPKVARCAAKMWCDEEMFQHLTLYYPDHLEYYVTLKASDASMGADFNETSFVPDRSRNGVINNGEQFTWPDNPYAPNLPVFHFQIEKRVVKSDIKNVLPLQNGMNKLMADMMITSEFSAWPQRWIISNSDVNSLQVKPGTILSLPGGVAGEQDTSAGEFKAADLNVYLNGVDKLIGYTSSITNTPKHYFDPSSDAPSGEALIAMEAPLNKKAQDRIDKFAPVWKKVAIFALGILGMAVDPKDLTVMFDQPETIQPKTQADIIKVNVDSTIPLETALVHAGWTQAEIDGMNKIKEAESKKAQSSLASALLKAQQDFKTQELPQGVRTPAEQGTLPINGGNQNVNA